MRSFTLLLIVVVCAVGSMAEVDLQSRYLWNQDQQQNSRFNPQANQNSRYNSGYNQQQLPNSRFNNGYNQQQNQNNRFNSAYNQQQQNRFNNQNWQNRQYYPNGLPIDFGNEFD